MFRKRLTSDLKEEITDPKRFKKTHFSEVIPKRAHKNRYFDESLADEYQPQFLNYQLIGDLLAIMILHSKDLMHKTKSSKPILYHNFCHSAWSVRDLLGELKAKKYSHPIAKTVILSVGYNDYHSNSIGALMLAETIDEIIQKLRRRGVRDIILTNIPPCAADSASVEHWKYLQIANEEIEKLSEKYDFICHCNIFRLFCSPNNYFDNCKDYVTFRDINYKIDFPMFNERGYANRRDLVSFSDLGKGILGKHVAKTVKTRLEFLRHGKVDRVICVLEEEDADKSPVELVDQSPVQVIDIKQSYSSSSKLADTKPDKKASVVIDLIIPDDDDDDADKVTCSNKFGCKCRNCAEEDDELMEGMVSVITSLHEI